MQMYNESIIFDDRFNIPRLMNMSFNPNSVEKSRNFEHDNNQRKTSRFDKEWTTPSKQQHEKIESASQYTS